MPSAKTTSMSWAAQCHFPFHTQAIRSTSPSVLERHLRGKGTYMFSLLLATLSVMHPFKYHPDETPVLCPWRRGQADVAEAGVSRLTSSYVYDDTGLNVCIAGSNVRGQESFVQADWDRWMKAAWEEGELEVQWKSGWSPYSRDG